jgi:hypothetical protein
MAGNSPSWKVDNAGITVFAVSAVAANLFLVPDATATKGAKIPVTASTPFMHKGVSRTAIAAGTYGTTYFEPGSTVVVKASGSVTKGDQLFVDTPSTKEGRAKTYVNFATNGVALLCGIAETTGVDGDLIEVLLTVPSAKTA